MNLQKENECLNHENDREQLSGVRSQLSAEDKNTISALSGGDHSAYDKIFLKYYDRSVAFARSLVRKEGDAEDIVTDVFMGLWLNRERLDPEKNFNAYLYSVIRNAVFNYFRNQKVRDRYAHTHTADTVGHSSDDEFIARETELLIELTVSQMPAQRRKIFELHHHEGKSNAEIAESLGISRKAVEKHLRLALADIRKVISLFIMFLSLG